MRKTFLEKCINLRLCRVALVLLFLVPAISSLQANPSQNKTISGVVTSATDSEPLIGVSVQVRETATGGRKHSDSLLHCLHSGTDIQPLTANLQTPYAVF